MKCAAIAIAALALGGWALPAAADGFVFQSQAAREQETVEPANPGSIRTASVQVSFARNLSIASVRLFVRPSERVVAVHFHCHRAGQDGPIAAGLMAPGRVRPLPHSLE